MLEPNVASPLADKLKSCFEQDRKERARREGREEAHATVAFNLWDSDLTALGEILSLTRHSIQSSMASRAIFLA